MKNLLSANDTQLSQVQLQINESRPRRCLFPCSPPSSILAHKQHQSPQKLQFQKVTQLDKKLLDYAMWREQAKTKLESLLDQIVEQAKDKARDKRRTKSFSMNLIRHKTLKYTNKQKQINVLFYRPGTCRSLLQATRVVCISQKVHQLITRGQHVTKRDLYYQNKDLFSKSQIALDSLIEDLAVTCQVPRDALNVHASGKGLVYGEAFIECYQQDHDNPPVLHCNYKPVLIPRDELVTRVVMDVNIQGVLVVEKEAIFDRLLEHIWTKDDRLNDQRLPFLLITGKGYPDKATLDFLRNLGNSIHIYTLVDYDPHGIQIHLKYASIYTSAHIIVNRLGLTYEDITLYTEDFLPCPGKLPLTQREQKLVKGILEKEGGGRFDNMLLIELKRMLCQGFKCEIEVLNDKLVTYLKKKLAKPRTQNATQ